MNLNVVLPKCYWQFKFLKMWIFSLWSFALFGQEVSWNLVLSEHFDFYVILKIIIAHHHQREIMLRMDPNRLKMP